MKKLIALVYIALACNSFSCFGWGKYGHQLVGDVAKVYVNKAVQDSVQQYLGDLSWGDASTWMDEIRSDHFYDYLKPMHYVNVDEGQTYVKTNDDNIINELDNVINELHNRDKLSKEKINEDLKILFHLMGDLHQPLHVGYGADKGGNTINVDFLGASTNLHKVWDTEMIQYDKTFKSELIEKSKRLTNTEIHKQQQPDALAWMNESRSYLPQVYDFKKGRIDEDYIEKNIPVTERQILYAGIRLSGVLNSIFDAKPEQSAFIAQQQIQETQLTSEEVNREQQMSSPEAPKYLEGTIITVCETVTGTHMGKSGVMMLNFGPAFPNNTFTAVVFEKDASKFKSATYYNGKKICVTGKITMYHGKPEIVLNKADQLVEK